MAKEEGLTLKQWHNLARGFILQKELLQALHVYQSLADENKDAEACNFLAYYYRMIGNLSQYRLYLEKAADGNNIFGLLNLSKAYMGGIKPFEVDYDKGLALYDRVMMKMQEDPVM